MKTHFVSMYWDNIPAPILEGQARVFDMLGLPLVQEKRHGVRHGVWMMEVMERLGPQDIVLFFDIDAFPLRTSIVERAVGVARDGGLFGLAQTANHRPSRNEVYAGPMFMAVSKATYERLGRPNLRSSSQYDAAQELSVAARAQQVSIDLVWPTACLETKWPLADKGVFGIGTFYGQNEAFHLFESRQHRNVSLFEAVAGDVAAGKPLDFARYLEIAASTDGNAGAPASKRPWYKRWRR